MHLSFWPNRAWQYLMAPCWPWAATQEVTFAPRIGAALGPYWASRITQVPDTVLGGRLRDKITLAMPSVGPESAGAAGFEMVAQAARGDADAFWFFELGNTAWMVALQRMRREGWFPENTDFDLLNTVETLWAGPDGPAQAAARLDQALAASDTSPDAPLPLALLLYRVPLAIWSDRNATHGAQLLSRALKHLPAGAAQVLGATIPLTFALTSALGGDIESAVTLLAEGRVPARPVGWTGYRTPEVRYQRARYCWALERYTAALDHLRLALHESPSYLLRLASDPAWIEPGTTTLPVQVQTLIGTMVAEARSAMARFTQGRAPNDENIPEVKRVVDTLAFGGDDPYGIVASAALLPALHAWRESQRTVGQSFAADLERLTQVVGEIPLSFPVRLGMDYGRRLQGGEDADMDRLVSLLDRGRFTHAEEFVDNLLRDLPVALRMGLFGYLQRLVNALATAGDVLRERGREEDEARYSKIVELVGVCMDLIEPIKQFSDEVGLGLAQQFNATWDRVTAIEASWVQSEARAFGAMRLIPRDEAAVVTRGGFKALTLSVVDVAGEPVPGVPVIWRVASGPCAAKDPIECLDGEWALSLQTGVVYLAVEAKGVGDGGIIEAWILGNYSPVSIPYRVMNRPR
jgi:tetratricopeptide (TPR) repeat protein